jgi:protease I
MENFSASGIRVAILVEKLYEETEFWYPYYRMKESGAEVVVVGTGADAYPGKHGLEARADTSADKASVEDFDAVIIPGGYCPDHLRRYAAVLKFVREMDQHDKVVAAICHAGWVLVSAGILKGRTATCFHSIKDDVINAGAKYVDKEVARDGNLITSRSPSDLPAFCREIIAALQKAKTTPKARAP